MADQPLVDGGCAWRPGGCWERKGQRTRVGSAPGNRQVGAPPREVGAAWRRHLLVGAGRERGSEGQAVWGAVG